VLTTRAFWGLALPFFVCGVTTTGMIDTHLIPFAHDHGHSPALAGGAVALLAAFNILGTLASGPLADSCDGRLILAGLYASRALTLVLLLVADAGGWLLVFGVLFGLVDFATVAPTQLLASQYFRDRSLGFVFGMIFLVHQVGSAVGAWVPGFVHDRTGSYDLAFAAAIATLVGAAAFSLALPRPEPARVPETAGV
jgi:predicted MFS family arabinose efflux permease